jgi:hypothetical protein
MASINLLVEYKLAFLDRTAIFIFLTFVCKRGSFR